MHVVLEGIMQALQHTNQRIIIQTDCVVLVQDLQSPHMDQSKVGFLIKELKPRVLVDRELLLMKIGHCQNRAVDLLANFTRVNRRSNILFLQSPVCIWIVIPADSNPIAWVIKLPFLHKKRVKLRKMSLQTIREKLERENLMRLRSLSGGKTLREVKNAWEKASVQDSEIQGIMLTP